MEYSNWCQNKPKKLDLKKPDNKTVYKTSKCPAGKARCGHFGDYVCKCGCKAQCSRWGWCGVGGLYLSTMQPKYSHLCKKVSKTHKQLKKSIKKLARKAKFHAKVARLHKKKALKAKKAVKAHKKKGNAKKAKKLRKRKLKALKKVQKHKAKRNLLRKTARKAKK